MLIARNSHSKAAQPFPSLDVSARLQPLWQSAREAWVARRKAQEERRAIRKAMAELSALDDLLLADMGIGRCGIHAAVTRNL